MNTSVQVSGSGDKLADMVGIIVFLVLIFLAFLLNLIPIVGVILSLVFAACSMGWVLGCSPMVWQKKLLLFGLAVVSFLFFHRHLPVLEMVVLFFAFLALICLGFWAGKKGDGKDEVWSGTQTLEDFNREAKKNRTG